MADAPDSKSGTSQGVCGFKSRLRHHWRSSSRRFRGRLGRLVEITAEQVASVLVLSPQGRLDSNTSPRLEERAFLEISGGTTRLVVDLSAIDYISSAGVRAFLAVARRLKDPPARLVLCGMAPSVRQIFDLAGFTAIFAIEGMRDDALARAAGP